MTLPAGRRAHKARPVQFLPQPYGMPGFSRPWFRARQICFVMADWDAVGDALSIACPYALYARDRTPIERLDKSLPLVPFTPHLGDHLVGPDHYPPNIIVSFFQNPFFAESADEKIWMLPYMYIRSVGRIYPAGIEPETIHASSIDFAVEPNNDGHVAFMRQIFSLFGRFSSNRHQVRVFCPGHKSDTPIERGELWLGHEAIRWALEDSRRVLNYLRYSGPNEPHAGAGIRPIDEKWAGYWPLPDIKSSAGGT